MTDTNGVSFNFFYDPVGNRLSQEVVLCDGCQAQTTDYTHDFANRLSTVGVISKLSQTGCQSPFVIHIG